MKNAKKPILSISLLVSNRMDTIPRCLDSLTPIREAIPSELIIVDTSNNPEVYECALKYTDYVEKFEWCNDFAKARNVGLSKAKGEWFMFIDDDEWFIDHKQLIEFFQSGEYKQYGHAHYLIRNYTRPNFELYTDGWGHRLIKREKNTRFYSKVHEYLAPITGKNKMLDIVVGHSGYAYKTEKERQEHFDRNVSLLTLMEKQEPRNLRWKTHMIQEYAADGKWEELEKYCQKTINYIYNENYQWGAVDVSVIYLAYIIALVSLHKPKEARAFYDKCEKLRSQTVLATAYMNCCIADACYEQHDYEAVRKYLKEFLEGYEKYQRDSLKYYAETIQPLLILAVKESRYILYNTLLLVAEFELKNYEAVYEIYPRLAWNTKEQKLKYNIHVRIIEALIILKDDEMLKTFLVDSFATEFVKHHVIKAILAWKSKDEFVFKKLVDIVKEVDIWEWYKLYIQLISSKMIESEDEVRSIGVSLMYQVPNIFQIPKMVIDAFERRNIEMESLYKEIDFMMWKKHLVEHFECVDMGKLDELQKRLEDSCLKNDVRFGYFMMLYSEQKLIQKADMGVGMDEYSDVLAAFSDYTCLTYNALYGAGIHELPIEELPNNYLAALWLKKFFEEAGQNLRGALPCLGKVTEVYPFLQECIKYYLYLIKTEVFQG